MTASDSSRSPDRSVAHPAAEQPERLPEPSKEEDAQFPLADEESTATGSNPDGELTGAWAASGELAQRPSSRRRHEEQRLRRANEQRALAADESATDESTTNETRGNQESTDQPSDTDERPNTE